MCLYVTALDATEFLHLAGSSAARALGAVAGEALAKAWDLMGRSFRRAFQFGRKLSQKRPGGCTEVSFC